MKTPCFEIIPLLTLVFAGFCHFDGRYFGMLFWLALTVVAYAVVRDDAHLDRDTDYWREIMDAKRESGK